MKKGFRRRLIFHAVRIGFAITTAFLLTRFPLHYLESYFYDLRVSLSPQTDPSGHIETVAIDNQTIKSLIRTPEFADHNKVLEKIIADNPKAIVYTFSPKKIEGTFDDKLRFSHLAGQIEHFYIASSELKTEGQEQERLLPVPLDTLNVEFGPKTADISVFAKDGVTRRALISYQHNPTLHFTLSKLIYPKRGALDLRGSFEFLDSQQLFIDFKPTGAYKSASFTDVIEKNVKPGRYTNKIVLIGLDTQTDSHDYIMTPFSRSIVAMSILEMHANVIDTFIQNTGAVRTPINVDIIVTALISIITVYVVLTLKPILGLIIIFTTVGVFLLSALILFAAGNIWIGMIQPVLAIFICYYFFIPYRLIMENRKSWEYYQKNKLLVQVEELKSNFISMMSHDLKTPLARIQGMTDMALTDTNPLSKKQKEALVFIRKSTSELTQFINSILNLGRIESKEIKLHLQGKDVNQLLDEVIHKYEYIAKGKHIEIRREFEPLFSIKMDIDLIRQVFSNLIENAIKYSPENSNVLVSTEEREGKIMVQVADQGMGMTNSELNRVFMKFYRSKDVKTSKIKGSGLGLYLAKYFVELHNGTITVESQPEQGSTFTVELPTTL